MKEEYKFAGFSSDIAIFAEVERYGMHLLERVFASQSDRSHWSMIESMSDGGFDKEELIRRRFALSPDTVTLACHNSATLKGVRLQVHDPAGDDGTRLSGNYGVTFAERPAIISAFMDTFGDPGMVRFSQDLVVTCELTTRTEALAKNLIRRYVCDAVSYEAMAPEAKAVSDRESQLWEKWKILRRQ